MFCNLAPTCYILIIFVVVVASIEADKDFKHEYDIDNWVKRAPEVIKYEHIASNLLIIVEPIKS